MRGFSALRALWPARRRAKRILAIACDVAARQEAGAVRMMDLADERGARISFFVDFAGGGPRSGRTAEAARAILRRGHDLQLLARAGRGVPSESFWRGHGYLAPDWPLANFDPTAIRILLGDSIEAYCALAGRPPAAYRGGGGQVSAAALRVLKDCGLRISSNCPPSAPPRGDGPSCPATPAAFRWDNGLIEIPVGSPRGASPAGKIKPLIFGLFQDPKELLACLDASWPPGAPCAVLCLWVDALSFLRTDERGNFIGQDDGAADLFRRFLDLLPRDVELLSMSQILERVDRGEIEIAPEIPIARAGGEETPLRPMGRALKTTPYGPALLEHYKRDFCNICGAPADEACRRGAAGAYECPGCGSLESHRVFKFAYDLFGRFEFSLDGKAVLLFGAGAAETEYLFRSAGAIEPLDLPQEAQRWRAAIEALDEKAAESFDLIFCASPRLAAALDGPTVEAIWRLLRSGGRLLSCTIPAAANLEQIALLARRFIVKTHYGLDPATCRKGSFLCVLKP